jgi:hypothetical protein
MDASSGGNAGEHGDDTTSRGMEDHPHLRPFMLLPAAPGTCPECAVVALFRAIGWQIDGL